MPLLKPTRTELLRLRKQLKLASRGLQILQNKEDSLKRELFILENQVREKNDSIAKQLGEIQSLLREAGKKSVFLGVSQQLETIKPNNEAELTFTKKWGTQIPQLKSGIAKRNPEERGYSLWGTALSFDLATEKAEETAIESIALANLALSQKSLGEELLKTRKRVNALKNFLIPRIQKQIQYIDYRLSELEREEFYRIKKVKELVRA